MCYQEPAKREYLSFFTIGKNKLLLVSVFLKKNDKEDSSKNGKPFFFLTRSLKIKIIIVKYC